MREDAQNDPNCADTHAPHLWWTRVQTFLEYRQRVGMTPADANGVWLIPALYGLSGARRLSVKQMAAKTAFTEGEIVQMRNYLEELIRICVPIKVKS
jgi:hypothetical protein